MRATGRDFYGAGGVLAHSLSAVASLERLVEELPGQFPAFHRLLSAHLNERVGRHPRLAHLKLVELFHDVGKPATLARVDGRVVFHGHEAEGARRVRAVRVGRIGRVIISARPAERIFVVYEVIGI